MVCRNSIMQAAMETETNNKLTRCPRLGQEIKFAYCWQESGKLPCARIVDCWAPSFDVEALLKEKLSPEAWQSFISIKPKDKVLSLIELIEAVKKRE
jgi:hypothetical protein